MKPKVCFISTYCYPLFNSQCHTMFGGWEVRISQIARDLAKRGNYDVSIIVADHGQPHFEVREGVQLISWEGKAFWGVPAEEKQSSELVINTSVIPITEGTSLSPTKHPTETQPKSKIVGETDMNGDLKLGVVKRFWSFLKGIVRRIYKRFVPWRVRIVITGLAAGSKEGSAYMARSVVVAFRVWMEALKTTARGFRYSLFIFKEYVQHSLSNARRALGNIGDKAVFQEMVSIYDEANADIYVVPGNNSLSAEVAWFCRYRNRAFIMLAGSDIDYAPEIRSNPDGADLYGESYSLKSYAIKNAKRHIVQNEHQAEMAKAFGCSTVLIRNPIDLELKYPRASNPRTILWVGNTHEQVKRPFLYLEVVRSLPAFSFIMIVTPVTEQDMQRLTKASQSIPNLTLLSRIPFEEVEQYYAQARIFVNTSHFEGFPNTFLQAGKYGVPIISLKVDPNEMISRHGCGLLCNDDVDQLRENIQKVMSDPELCAHLGSRIFQYVKQYHDKDRIIPQYEEVFRSIFYPSYPLTEPNIS